MSKLVRDSCFTRVTMKRPKVIEVNERSKTDRYGCNCNRACPPSRNKRPKAHHPIRNENPSSPENAMNLFLTIHLRGHFRFRQRSLLWLVLFATLAGQTERNRPHFHLQRVDGRSLSQPDCDRSVARQRSSAWHLQPTDPQLGLRPQLR